MAKSKIILTILFSLIVCILLYLGYVYSLSLNKVGFQSDKVYFNMNPLALKIIKGKPIVYKDLKDLTGSENYIYLEFAYNYPCYVTYSFKKGFFYKLTEIYVSFPRLNSEEIKELFYKIRDNMIEIYSKKENHYDNGIIDESKLISEFGTRNGATGISVLIKTFENELQITIDSQF